jgi:hypothetical protein
MPLMAAPTITAVCASSEVSLWLGLWRLVELVEHALTHLRVMYGQS